MSIWSHYDLYVVRQHGVLAKLSAEDMSRYSNTIIESVGLRKCPHYHYITQQSDVTKQAFFRACSTSWQENSWHRYVIKKSRHCHPVCSQV